MLSTNDFQSEVGEVSAKLVANFRRSLEDDVRASLAEKIVRSMFHQNSTANSTTKLHCEVLGGRGPYHVATYRPIIARHPQKNKYEHICDTIATSIARYDRYHCWASKSRALGFVLSSPLGQASDLPLHEARTG